MGTFTVFQSTLPAWGATVLTVRVLLQNDISIHAPRMGSDLLWQRSTPYRLRISIHAPRMGSDQDALNSWKAVFDISIHAPRMGSDITCSADTATAGDFNPRSPHGERRGNPVVLWSITIFQSTLPAWGATAIKKRRTIHAQFQSTLPAWGATMLSHQTDRTA